MVLCCVQLRFKKSSPRWRIVGRECKILLEEFGGQRPCTRHAQVEKRVIVVDHPEEVAVEDYQLTDQNIDCGFVQLAVNQSTHSVELVQPAVDRPVNHTSVLSCFLFGFWIRFRSEFGSVSFLFFMDSLAI